MHSIPDELDCSKIPQALQELVIEGVPRNRASTSYCLVFEGRHFAPKPVISRAYKVMFGTELMAWEFPGGEQAANPWLRECGYNVIRCQSSCGGLGKTSL